MSTGISILSSNFSSSEDEADYVIDYTPFQIDWLDLSCFGCSVEQLIGISALPGCNFKETHRSLSYDIECLKKEGVTNVISLCTMYELHHYRVPTLLSELSTANITVHHHPFRDGLAPSYNVLTDILRQLKINLMNSKKTIVHCYGGYGRSGLVAACFMMFIDENITPDSAISQIRLLRGPRAIQTIKQFNFIQDFHENFASYEKEVNEHRSISR